MYIKIQVFIRNGIGDYLVKMDDIPEHPAVRRFMSVMKGPIE